MRNVQRAGGGRLHDPRGRCRGEPGPLRKQVRNKKKYSTVILALFDIFPLFSKLFLFKLGFYLEFLIFVQSSFVFYIIVGVLAN